MQFNVCVRFLCIILFRHQPRSLGTGTRERSAMHQSVVSCFASKKARSVSFYRFSSSFLAFSSFLIPSVSSLIIAEFTRNLQR